MPLGDAAGASLLTNVYTQNRLNKRCATLLAGSVSLNTSLSDLQLNHNPLSRAGAAMLIHTFNLNSFLKRWGLTGVGSALQVSRVVDRLPATTPTLLRLRQPGA